jgi:Kef-type K+ transport system membrane component KefB
MPTLSFNGLLVVALVAVAVPVLLALVPRLPVPGAVLEVVAGILVGPSVLGWVHLDAPVRVVSDLGLGMLLFLAGLEIDVGGLRGPLGRLAGWAFGVSVLLGLACGYAFSLAGVGGKPVFLAVVLTSTSAGLLLPLLKDAGLHRAPLGQLVMAGAALAEVVPVMLLPAVLGHVEHVGRPAELPGGVARRPGGHRPCPRARPEPGRAGPAARPAG